jgi:6-pyruvoyltetrahydropterin/6-carboxytetrahydropterin synthase
MAIICVTHNIEIAHRLTHLPGKCEQIHGHSMVVTLGLKGRINSKGLLSDLDFGHVKRAFRDHLDTKYDHHLLLNENDPWAGPISLPDGTYVSGSRTTQLPGLVTFPGDPTTENIAKWIAQWATDAFRKSVEVYIAETDTNGVTVDSNDLTEDASDYTTDQ